MNILESIGEFIAAVLVFGAFYWVPWLYYLITGNYLNFGI